MIAEKKDVPKAVERANELLSDGHCAFTAVAIFYLLDPLDPKVLDDFGHHPWGCPFEYSTVMYLDSVKIHSSE